MASGDLCSLLVDARKAFDSVDHNYMQGVLEAYGFGWALRQLTNKKFHEKRE